MAKRHGKTNTPEYKIWWRIMQQCRNKNRPEYKNVGAKGIDVCNDWQAFELFYHDMKKMPEGCNTIIRLDPNLDFSKQNCKWGYVAIGRPRKPSKAKTKVSRKRRIKNPYLLGCTIERDLFDYIKRVAIQKSAQTGVNIEANDLIREALSKAFPILCQTDIFGDKLER